MAPGRGEIRMPPVSVCHQVSTIGQRPLPTTSSYQFQASGLIGSPTEPRMRRRREVVLLHPLVALAHQRADGGGRGVEDVDLVLLADRPEAAGVRPGRHALEHQRGGAVGQRPVDDVAVAGHPADVRGAPVDVAVVVVEDVLVGHRHVDEVAAGGVQHPLGLAGRARGVEDEERVLGADRHRLAVVGDASPSPRAARRRGPQSQATSPPVRFTTSDFTSSEPCSSALSTLALSGGPAAAARRLVGGDDEPARRSR